MDEWTDRYDDDKQYPHVSGSWRGQKTNHCSNRGSKAKLRHFAGVEVQTVGPLWRGSVVAGACGLAASVT